LCLTVGVCVNAQSGNCPAYCSLFFNASFQNVCGQSPDFMTQNDCMTWCNTFIGNLNGTTGDAAGNTIGCRIYHANAAITTGDPTHCDHASLTGGAMCGTLCDNYCTTVLNGTCSGMYGDMNTCMLACASFPTNGTHINISKPENWKNNVECRIYHAGLPAIASTTIHCPHASPHGGGACVDTAGDKCTGYCQLYLRACSNYLPINMISVASCVQFCKNYSTLVASYADVSKYLPASSTGDTINCRSYHSTAALTDPTTHCGHASFLGGDVCGSYCQVYCNLASNPSCTSNINFGTQTCATFCTKYVSTGTTQSTADNTIQCRIYHLGVAMTVPVPHCNHGQDMGPCASAALAPAPAALAPANANSMVPPIVILLILVVIALFL